jgi:hypothetical protein
MSREAYNQQVGQRWPIARRHEVRKHTPQGYAWATLFVVNVLLFILLPVGWLRVAPVGYCNVLSGIGHRYSYGSLWLPPKYEILCFVR